MSDKEEKGNPLKRKEVRAKLADKSKPTIQKEETKKIKRNCDIRIFGAVSHSSNAFGLSHSQASGSGLSKVSVAKRSRPRSASESISPVSKKMGSEDLITKISQIFDNKFSAFTADFNNKFSQLATKEEFAAMSVEVSNLRKENADLKAELVQLRNAQISTDKRVQSIENQSRMGNLIVRGLAVDKDADLQLVVNKLLRNDLKIDKPIPLSARPLYSAGNRQKSLVLVTPQNSNDKWMILRNSFNLKGTGISISLDFDQNTRKKRGKLLAIRSFLRKSIPNPPPIRLKNDRLLIADESYFWDDAAGLVDSSSGVQRSIGDVDLSICIAGLLNGGSNMSIDEQRLPTMQKLPGQPPLSTVHPLFSNSHA